MTLQEQLELAYMVGAKAGMDSATRIFQGEASLDVEAMATAYAREPHPLTTAAELADKWRPTRVADDQGHEKLEGAE